MNAPITTRETRKPAVVMLHSSASSARQWQGLIDTLQIGHDVHTIEFHGHGTQPDWHGDALMTLADEAVRVEVLLERLGGAHLIGHSYGAAVALKVASRQPALVRSIVAYEPVLFRLLQDDVDSRDETLSVTRVVQAMRMHLDFAQPLVAAQHFIDLWSGAGAWATLSADRQKAFAARVPAVLRHFDALFGDTLSAADLARLRVPLLVLSGARTVPATRRIAELIGASCPDVQCEVLADMGHMGPITHAAQFNRRAFEFVTATYTSRGPAPGGTDRRRAPNFQVAKLAGAPQ